MQKLKLLIFTTITCIAGSVFAGHHHETALARKYHMYDLTDIYCFPSSNAGKTTFIMVFNPKASSDSAFTKNFGDKNGLYQLHIGQNKELTEGMTFSFQFVNGKINVYLLKNAAPTLGEMGQKIGRGKALETVKISGGISVWSGIVKDPFNGNSVGLHKFKTNVANGKWDENVFLSEKGNDRFSDFIDCAVVIDIPNELLGKNIFYHASSSIKLKGTEKGHRHAHWHTVNRIGHVLLPHLYLSTESQKETQMAAGILTDKDRKSAVVQTIIKYVSLAKSQQEPAIYAQNIADMLLPDYVPYEVGTPASYTWPRLNGRKLTDDAMDTALEILVGKPFSDYVPLNNHYNPNQFPYLLSNKSG